MSFLNKTKHYVRDLFRYPAMKAGDERYDTYWESRDISTPTLNSFQKKRADFLLDLLKDGDSILDVGCGDGKMLAYLKEKKDLGQLLGIDSSSMALEKARQRGVQVFQKDIRDSSQLADVPQADFIVLFEVLEHMINSEELLAWATKNARKAVVFSVPNTGFIVHRLRLLLGRFPLQWKAHPSEHVRFWTVRDMRWWLDSLRYRYELFTYEGVPVLNRLWPSLFAAGLMVTLPYRGR